MHVCTSTGSRPTRTIGTFAGFGDVWFDPLGLANILSLKLVQDMGYRVRYDTLSGRHFVLSHPTTGEEIIFRESKYGLYYHDMAGIQSQSAAALTTINDPTTVATVAARAAKYTRADYLRALAARRLQVTTGRPSTRDLSVVAMDKINLDFGRGGFDPYLDRLFQESMIHLVPHPPVKITDLPQLSWDAAMNKTRKTDAEMKDWRASKLQREKDEENRLKHLLAHGREPEYLLGPSEKRKPRTKEEQKEVDAEVLRAKQKRRREFKLNTKTGRPKKHTKVMTSQGKIAKDHAFFDGIPHRMEREVDTALFTHLGELENQIMDTLPKSIKEGTKHNSGGNDGLNIGISVVDGGPESDKEQDISGTVQMSCAYRYLEEKNPTLLKDYYGTLRKITSEAYGGTYYYEKMVYLSERLNKESGEVRSIPGFPLTSGVWLSTKPKEGSVHTDKNNVGFGFLLSTTETTVPVSLQTYHVGTDTVKGVKVIPGVVIGGKFAEGAHCNTGVLEGVNSHRTSVTGYGDYRVFSTRYKCNSPLAKCILNST